MDLRSFRLRFFAVTAQAAGLSALLVVAGCGDAPLQVVSGPATLPPATADDGQALPSLMLDLRLAEDEVTPGQNLAFELHVENHGRAAADAVVIDLPLAEGVSGAAQRYEIGRVEPGSEAVVNGEITVSSSSHGAAVVLRPELRARGVEAVIGDVEGALVRAREHLMPAQARFVPGQAASLTSADGKLSVELPRRLHSRALKIEHAAVQDDSYPSSAGFKRGLGAFTLTATDDGGKGVHEFEQPAKLELEYSEQELDARGISEQDLTLFWFDEDREAWIPVESSVDVNRNRVLAELPHFSAYQLGDGSSPSAAFLPSLKGWQVSTLTGSATYSYGFEMPAGPHGIKPELTLSYSSASSDGKGGARLKQQAGWVGAGFSLDTGSIGMQKMQVYSTENPYFNVVFNGQSHELVRGPALVANPSQADPTHWEWRAADEKFVRARVVSAGLSSPTRGGYHWGNPRPRYRWQIWTKDGTRYDFDEDLWWGFTQCTGTGSGDYAYMEPYRWMLSKVTDTHGNTIRYDYGRVSAAFGETCFHVQGVADTSIWPTTISWGGNERAGTPHRYRVQFVSSDRVADRTWDFANNQYGGVNGAYHETKRLDAIKLLSNSGAGWQLVTQYNFSYDYSTYTDRMVWNGTQMVPDGASAKLTLRQIQRVGSDGTTALPPVKFKYGPWAAQNDTAVDPLVYYMAGSANRLVSVNNGQGGVVTFDYENIGWTLRTQKYAGFFNNNRRVTSRTITDGVGGASTWSYKYGTPAYNSLGSAVTKNAYDGPLEYPNSAALYFNKYFDPLHDGRSFLVHAAQTAFRGHANVTETDPSGAQTKHYFYLGNDACKYPGYPGEPIAHEPYISQNPCFQALRTKEFLKGREYKTQTFGPASAGSPLLREVEHVWQVDFLDYTQTALAGLWRAFVHEDELIEREYNESTTPVVKTKRYSYNTQYGNRTRVEEYSGEGNAAVLMRATEHRWGTRNTASSYIVDRETSQAVRDSQNRLVALSHFFYDGNDAALHQLGDEGALTRVIRYTNVPLVTSLDGVALRGQDTTYAYDAYGNRTVVRTYPEESTATASGGSWSFSAAGGGTAPRRTVTQYDPTFHAYSVSVTDALGMVEQATYDTRMGTLTSTTDANDNTTRAAYDTFGRMVRLSKPGDDDGAPTLTAQHFDSEIPIRYVTIARETAGGAATRTTQKFYDGLGREIQMKRESAEGAENIVVDKVYDGLDRVIRESQPRYVSQTSATFGTRAPIESDAVMRWTRTSYDALGRVVRVTKPDGTATEQQYRVLSDASGSYVAEETLDAGLHVSERHKDALGRLAKVVAYSGNCGSLGSFMVPCASGQQSWVPYATTTYAYTAVDQLKRVTDTLGNVTTITHDSLGRKTSLTDPDMGAWSFEYDAAGNLAAQTDAKQQRITFGYDALNRLTHKTLPDGSQSVYRYDEADFGNGRGRRTSMSNEKTTVRFGYDALGHKTLEQHEVVGWPARTLRWEYDSAERLTSVEYPDGDVLTYSYDDAGRATRACSTLGSCIVTNSLYNADGEAVEVTLGNGLVQRAEYEDSTSRLRQLQVDDSSGTALFDRAYGYTTNGNVRTLTDPGYTQSFGYDTQDRLSSWSSASRSENYSYDAVGNLVSKGHDSLQYGRQGSTAGGPHAVIARAGEPYTYDANGNLLSGGGRSIEWTADNLPLRVDVEGGVQETYTYSADNERVLVTSAAGETLHIGRFWVEGSDGASHALYSFNGRVIAQRDSALSSHTVNYLHSDHLGSISLVTNQDGGVEQRQEFDPWGQVIAGEVNLSSLSFTGQESDATGLLYYQARFYDPALGRFISADTIVPGAPNGSTWGGGASDDLTVGFSEYDMLSDANKANVELSSKGFLLDGKQSKTWSGPESPQQLNRYSYVGNNPLRYTDPSGHCWTLAIGSQVSIGFFYGISRSWGMLINCKGIWFYETTARGPYLGVNIGGGPTLAVYFTDDMSKIAGKGTVVGVDGQVIGGAVYGSGGLVGFGISGGKGIAVGVYGMNTNTRIQQAHAFFGRAPTCATDIRRCGQPFPAAKPPTRTATVTPSSAR